MGHFTDPQMSGSEVLSIWASNWSPSHVGKTLHGKDAWMALTCPRPRRQNLKLYSIPEKGSGGDHRATESFIHPASVDSKGISEQMKHREVMLPKLKSSFNCQPGTIGARGPRMVAAGGYKFSSLVGLIIIIMLGVISLFG